MEERAARKKGEPRLLLSLLCVPRTAASGIARRLLRVVQRHSRPRAGLHSDRRLTTPCAASPHLQPNGGYQEIKRPHSRIARDLDDRRRHRRVALQNEEQPGQCRLRAAQHHHPLRTGMLPPPHGSAELQRARQNRPDAEHREHRRQARTQRRKYRQCRDGADRDVDRLRAVCRHPPLRARSTKLASASHAG